MPYLPLKPNENISWNVKIEGMVRKDFVTIFAPYMVLEIILEIIL